MDSTDNVRNIRGVAVYEGDECVWRHRDALALGKRAFIVTGKHSAKQSGAIYDVMLALCANSIEYFVFDGATANPPVMMCHKGGQKCRLAGCDFVIAVGGGSVIDAGKAIAAFAANPALDEDTLYTANVSRALPIAAVPTTSGTGSEVNNYSVLTLSDGIRKRTYKSAVSYPKAAFLDPRYTESIADAGAVSCALDALAHAYESYLSPKSDGESREAAKEAARGVLSVLMKKNGDFTREERQTLQLAATSGGQAIDVTGTGFPHPLGYSITLSLGVPHGRACALFFGEYVDFNSTLREGRELIGEISDFTGYDIDEVKSRIAELAHNDISLSCEVCEEYIDRVAASASFKNSPYVLSRREMSEIYERLFRRGASKTKSFSPRTY
ncbi:MAG: iron-containing alcohol dehydrogenase [Firmicutes bacterium]|nr:iron-containing alcohol dehydrogenase [Bacillota bacterium]